MLENTNNQITFINPELYAHILNAIMQKEYTSPKVVPTRIDDKKTINRENFPLLISVNEAKNIGITRNNFYDIANKHPELTVGIQQRKFLDRDKLFAWLDNGGDNKRVKGVA